MKSASCKIGFTIGFFVYWVICFSLTHVPLRMSAAPRLLKTPLLDKVVHFSLFFLLAFLFAYLIDLWFGKPNNRLRTLAIPTATLLFCAVYGIIDEVTQMITTTRTADPMDWCVDMVGSIAGLSALYLLWKWK